MAAEGVGQTYRKSLLLSQVESFSNNSRMHAFLDIPVRLLQQLSDEEDDRSRSVSCLLILGDSCPSDHSGGGVLFDQLNPLHTIRVG